MNRRLGGSLLPLLLLVTACTTPEPRPVVETDAPAVFADCAGLTAPLPRAAGSATAGSATAGSATAGSATAGPATAGPGRPLPELTLPCFTGGADVALGALSGPAVINLWASWCPPCREELPAFQRLSEQTGGRLRVVGVNTRDRRSAAESVGTDFGLDFPTLSDPDERLRRALGRPFLPITLFVDGAGRIRHQDETGALDDAALAGLVRRHLGVAVPS